MYAGPRIPPHNTACRRRILAFFIIGGLLAIGGCAATDLYQFQRHAADGDHEWIATSAVDCDEPSDACRQLHLIKGNACFQLASAGTAPLDNFACAADELQKGLNQPATPDETADRRAHRERFCESLRMLLVLLPGDAVDVDPIRERFSEAAAALYRSAPGSVAAVYYTASARYHQHQDRIATLSPASRIPVCSRLKRTMGRVLSAIKTAELAPPAAWAEYSDRYERLAYDLGLALRTAGCH